MALHVFCYLLIIYITGIGEHNLNGVEEQQWHIMQISRLQYIQQYLDASAHTHTR